MKIERGAPRVVFDTNILISALLSPRGAPFQCLALARLGRTRSVSCSQIMHEFQEKLLTKFRYAPEEAQQAVAEIERFSEMVSLRGVSIEEVADPDDWMVIECAIVGGADYIVSGDRHLLSLGKYNNIEILSARQFLQKIATETFPEDGGQAT